MNGDVIANVFFHFSSIFDNNSRLLNGTSGSKLRLAVSYNTVTSLWIARSSFKASFSESKWR